MNSIINGLEYRNALTADVCIWCEHHYGSWQKFIRLFWAPWWCNISIYWRICCSSKCYTLFLEQQLEACHVNGDGTGSRDVSKEVVVDG